MAVVAQVGPAGALDLVASLLAFQSKSVPLVVRPESTTFCRKVLSGRLRSAEHTSLPIPRSRIFWQRSYLSNRVDHQRALPRLEQEWHISTKRVIASIPQPVHATICTRERPWKKVS